MEMIACACGCGELIPAIAPYGRPRSFVNGHARKNLQFVPERPCIICGKGFRPVGTPKRKLCSIDCRTEHLRQVGGRPNLQRLVPCFTCAKPVLRKRSQGQQRSFCSPECKKEWMSDYLKATRPLTNPKSQARARDEQRCRKCGFDIWVEVHHIDPRREDGSEQLANLITLCPNHHAMADYGLISREELRSLLPEN